MRFEATSPKARNGSDWPFLEIKKLFQTMDTSGDGTINYEEPGIQCRWGHLQSGGGIVFEVIWFGLICLVLIVLHDYLLYSIKSFL